VTTDHGELDDTIAQGLCLIVAAHPDDEVIGASTYLLRESNVGVVHVTDGAPRDRKFWPNGAPASRALYAEARALEAANALALAAPERLLVATFSIADQEAPYYLGPLARALDRAIGALAPRTIVCHAYEGGHPDHDATAFAVRAAIELVRARSGTAPDLVEMTSYHLWNGVLRTGKFLPTGEREEVRRLTTREQNMKARMLACFGTQTEVLRAFTSLGEERFRVAPAYDFTRPPHEGLLHYESLGWQMSGAEFCERAKEASAELRLDRVPVQRGARSWN
jgi:LmbE family N-acetylglucosaminyl deacetylase